MKGKLFFSVFLIGLIFLMGVGSAAFSYKGNNIVKSYAGGESIEGNVNISFSNELAENVLSTNFGQNISLLNFLKENFLDPNVDFNCSTVSCGTDYVSVSSINSVSLTSGNEEFVGFKIAGSDIEGISELGVDVSSNAASSCGEQLSFELIGEDRELEYINNKYVDSKCGVENYGCFEFGLGSYATATIGTNRLCEKISLPSGPAFTLGARVKNTTNGVTGTLKMELYDSDENFLIGNNLPKHTESEQVLKTIVNYTNSKGGEYFVCISGDSGTEYKINRETSGETCGTNSFGNDNFNKDYEIFAHPLKSGAVDFSVKEGPLDGVVGESILDFVEEYVSEHYFDVCSPECIIPIKLSGVTQVVNFANSKIKYVDDGDNLESLQMYSINKAPAKITSQNLKLDLSVLDIVVPLGTKSNSEFKLFLNGNLIFKEDITVEKSFDFSIKPKFALVGIETKFEAVTTEKINSSSWKFGDGGTRNVIGKNASYTYLNSGSYEVEVELINGVGVKSKKVFDVVSGNAKESANLTINKYEDRISKIGDYYNTLNSWIKGELEKSVSPGLLTASLKGIKEDFLLGGNETDYVDIMNRLLDLNVPQSVSVSERGELPISSGLDGIDTDYIEEISGKTGEGDIEGSIISWMNENYGASVDFEVYEAIYDAGSEELITKFKYDIKKKSNFDDSVYLFIDYPIESINFMESYGERQIGGGSGAYIILTGDKTVEFTISEKISVEDLRAYISPEVKSLPVFVDDSDAREREKDKFDFSFGKFGIGTIVLIILFFVVYIILQEWYKRNYERHLFKGRDSLYNLLSFIYNGRASKMRDNEIRQKLKGRGWTGEQITYAFNKIDGRRTGMFEIPLFKSAENNKVKKEIQRRLPPGKRVDTRFIKRPRF